MCFNDVQFGRTAARTIRHVQLEVAAKQLVAPDARRIGLILFAHNAARYTLGEGPDVVADQGPTIQAATDPLSLSVMEYGQLVTGELWAIASGAATHVGVIEVFLPRDPQ